MGPGVRCIRPKRRVATTWPSRGQPPSWGKCVTYGQFPMYPASKPTIGVLPIDPTIPHSPNSMNPTRPTTARNAADVGLSRSCTEVDPAILPRRAKLAESEESRSVRARPWFDSLQSRFGDFLPIHLTPKISQLKCHLSTHKNNIRNGLNTKPASK